MNRILKNTRKIVIFLLNIMAIGILFDMGAVQAAEKTILLKAEEYDVEQSIETVLDHNVDNQGNAAVITEENGSVCWTFFNETADTYYIKVNYYTIEGNSLQMERKILIDGEELTDSSVVFNRSYSITGDKRYDRQGNEIRREESENFCWQEVYLKDSKGYQQEEISVELSEGEHSIELKSLLDRMAIGSIELVSSVPKTDSYENVIQKQTKQGVTAASAELIKIQGEEYANKSDASILVKSDRSSGATEPASEATIIYNAIGGSSWADSGQWIEWQVEVPQDGWYQIGMRWRQSAKIGGMSSRSLSIDGEIPFTEARQIDFCYDNSWTTSFLGDTPYRFYMTKGSHLVRLTVNLGQMSEILEKTDRLVNELNDIYMQIIMISGSEPDYKRDYDFAGQIPEVITKYSEKAEEINSLVNEIDQKTNGKQSTTEFKAMSALLEQLADDPESSAKRLKDFASCISSMATWLSDSRRQPLEVDYLFVTAPEAGLPKEKVGFFGEIVFQIKQLVASYYMDYTSIGNTSEKSEDEEALQVWVIAGTEQAQLIQKLINEQFVSKTSIPVEMQNVTQAALMPAIFAGRGPDVVLNLDEATPVNYALRNVVLDLRQFDDVDEVLSQYEKCSYEAFCLDDGLYALPTTMDYPVLFYRKDIMEEMGIDLADCETWDTMLQVTLPKLQMKNLKFGLTPSLNSFLTFYYQSGSELYDDTKTKILLDQKEAVNAFADYTSIYTDYKQNREFNFVNLFRSGEMPLAVMPYSQYYQLAVFAPEIEGQWGIMMAPGTETENGEVRHDVACTVTGASILSDTKSKEASWEFLKWWTGDETQTVYAREIETLLGIAGRVNPASLAARDTIAWKKEVKAVLGEQLEQCRGIPQVAGSYYVGRYFDFAYRDVVYDGDDIVQTLISITEDINKEIREKTLELKKGE